MGNRLKVFGYVLWTLFGIWGFIIEISILNSVLGFWGVILCFLFLPVALVAVPWYALVALKILYPLLIVYGGTLLSLIIIIGSNESNEKNHYNAG